MYWNVPRIVPCAVRFGGVVGSIDSPAPRDRVAALAFARPKSRSFAPAFVSITLPGFRSRWTMPCRCAVLERVGNLDGDLQRLVERQRALRQASASVSPSRYSMTRNAVPSLLADVVEGADVRMVELRDRPRLALEALAELRIGRERVGQDLDRDGAIEARVAGPVDLAHAAGAEGGEDFVRAEAGAGGKGHGCGRRV